MQAVRRRLDPGADRTEEHARIAPGSHDGSASLRRRRDELVAHVAELHWDLGGLTYEMAIRDHFRLDVLVGKAAELQERDAELGELERVLSLQENAGAGQCPSCGALRSRGAVYCWQCGAALMERAPSATAADVASATDADTVARAASADASTVGSADASTVRSADASTVGSASEAVAADPGGTAGSANGGATSSQS